MPVTQDYLSLNDYFNQTNKKIILNRLSFYETTTDSLKQLLYSEYESEFSLIPQCLCGYYKGTFRIGQVCPKCNTEVTKVFDDIKPLLWVEKYREDLPFISPYFWAKVSALLAPRQARGKKYDGLRWLADSSYRMEPTTILKSLEALIGGRSYKNVLNNMEKILITIASQPQAGKKMKANLLLNFWETQKHQIISDYLPLINRRLFVAEKVHKTKYVSTMLADIEDIATTAMRVAQLPPESKRVENTTAYLISESASLFLKYIQEKMASKKGGVRKHVYGSRLHFTFRTVITSLSNKEDYDVCHVPWVVGLEAYRPHLFNKLYRRGIKTKDIFRILNEAAKQYDPLIDELLQELIAESPYKGLPIIFHRNPTLKQGSMQRLFITKFKTDIEDLTTSFSIMVAKSPNADC